MQLAARGFVFLLVIPAKAGIQRLCFFQEKDERHWMTSLSAVESPARSARE
jgi:hypothetical protein